ncbi:MAG: DUF5658 family protein [Chloroflexota bacterium]
MKYLLGILIVLVVADGVITEILVRSGIAREGNPFLVPFVGDIGFMVLKVVGASLCALILWDISRRHLRLARLVTIGGVLFYTTILLWNLSVYTLAGV